MQLSAGLFWSRKRGKKDWIPGQNSVDDIPLSWEAMPGDATLAQKLIADFKSPTISIFSDHFWTINLLAMFFSPSKSCPDFSKDTLGGPERP